MFSINGKSLSENGEGGGRRQCKRALQPDLQMVKHVNGEICFLWPVNGVPAA